MLKPTPSDPAQPFTRVGVYGASGTTGTELVRILQIHPRCLVAFATSREHAGGSLRQVDPSAPDVPLVDPREASLDEIEVAMLCLPHGRSAGFAEQAFEHGRRVVDLSGDLRLRSVDAHERVYGSPRNEALLEHTVYGLTEFVRDRLGTETRIVSNPGCYPTCSALALQPLVAGGHVTGPVIINALSGVSGAGRKPSAATHFCAVAGDVRPYNLGRSHRHAAEIEQTLADNAPDGEPLRVVFNPHVVPIERGMLVTAVVHCPALDARAARELYRSAYADEPFVEVLPPGVTARIRGVVRTNRAAIGIEEAEGTDHLVITCAIDNLVKGAAGQAVQNLNRMLGLDETTGLLQVQETLP